MRKNPEQVAWAVTLIAFATFCFIIVAVPLGIRWYILYAEQERAALVESLVGTVVIDPPVGQGPMPLSKGRGQTISEGTVIRVDETSEATITFFDNSFARLFSGTTVRVDRLSAPRFRASSLPSPAAAHRRARSLGRQWRHQGTLHPSRHAARGHCRRREESDQRQARSAGMTLPETGALVRRDAAPHRRRPYRTGSARQGRVHRQATGPAERFLLDHALVQLFRAALPAGRASRQRRQRGGADQLYAGARARRANAPTLQHRRLCPLRGGPGRAGAGGCGAHHLLHHEPLLPARARGAAALRGAGAPD